MNTLLLFLISLYQRWISPHKGFRCAHAAHYGGPSCSQAVRTIIASQGLLLGWPRIRLRFEECRAAGHALRQESPEERERRRRRRRDAAAACPNYCDPDVSDLCCAAESGCESLDCLPDFSSRLR